MIKLTVFRSPTDRLGHKWSVAAVRQFYFFVFQVCCCRFFSDRPDEILVRVGILWCFQTSRCPFRHALSILDSETVQNGERYIVPMLWIDSNVSLPNNYYSSLAQLERRLSKDPELRERYAETIREDIRKGYVVTVEPHDSRKGSDREWYLPHHPVVNPNKPVKVRRVLNGASKFHGTSLNKSSLVGPDLLQKLIFVYYAIPSTQVRRLRGYRGYVHPGRSPCPRSNFAPFFVAGGYHFRCDSSSVHSPYIRRTGFAYVCQFRVAKNSN